MKRVFISLLFGSCILTSTAFAQTCSLDGSSGIVTCTNKSPTQAEINGWVSSGAHTVIINSNTANGVDIISDTIDLRSLNTTINTIVNNSYGAFANQSSTAKFGNNTNINSNGSGAHAQDNSTIIFGNNTNINTSGISSVGVNAEDNSTIKFGNNTNITANFGYGARARDNSTITFGNNTNITGATFADHNSTIAFGNNTNITSNTI